MSGVAATYDPYIGDTSFSDAGSGSIRGLHYSIDEDYRGMRPLWPERAAGDHYEELP